jgi:hypothetical protein
MSTFSEISSLVDIGLQVQGVYVPDRARLLAQTGRALFAGYRACFLLPDGTDMGVLACWHQRQIIGVAVTARFRKAG